MLDYIREFIEFILDWIPRWYIIRCYESGVKLTLGNYKKTLTHENGLWGKGAHFYWPIVSDILKLPIMPQLERLPCQSIETSDGISVGVSGAVEYSVVDAKCALLDVQDMEDSLLHLTTGTMSRYVNAKSLAECRDLEALEKEIVSGIRKRATEWGLKIRKFYITDLATHQAIRIMKGGDSDVIVLPGDDS